jgi:hypothetical protein
LIAALRSQWHEYFHKSHKVKKPDKLYGHKFESINSTPVQRRQEGYTQDQLNYSSGEMQL